MGNKHRLLFNGKVKNGEHLAILYVKSGVDISLFTMQQRPSNYYYYKDEGIFVYRSKDEMNFDNSGVEVMENNVISLSKFLGERHANWNNKVILLDIENGKDIEFTVDNYDYEPKVFLHNDGYNEYSTITINIRPGNFNHTLTFVDLPSTTRVVLNCEAVVGFRNEGNTNALPVFLNCQCPVIFNYHDNDTLECIKGWHSLHLLERERLQYKSEKYPDNTVYKGNDILGRIKDFNERRGLIADGFSIKRELAYILEEVIEATDGNIKSEEAKVKAYEILDTLEFSDDTTFAQQLDAFIDIFVFAVGAMYKIAPLMGDDFSVEEEIMKVVRNIEHKPYLKDENGKVIKDPKYIEYRENKK